MMWVVVNLRLWIFPISMLIATPFTRAQSPPPIETPSTFPSQAPSQIETLKPSLWPTSKPSNIPTVIEAELRSFTETAITIILTGVLPLNPEETLYFQTRTEEYIEFYYNNGAAERLSLTGSRGVYDVNVTISNISMNPPFTNVRKLANKCSTEAAADIHHQDGIGPCASFSNRRRLQIEDELRIKYDQTMIYRFDGLLDEETAAELTNKYLIQDPFNTIIRRSDYIDFLRGGQSSDPDARVFENLTKVGPPELFVERKEISMLTIIASAAGGGVFLLVIIVFFIWRKRKGKAMDDDDFRDYDPRRMGENRVLPLSDNSTLEEPRQDGVFRSQNSIQGRGYPGSIVTDDPDYMYSQSYYGGEQTVISATDGTMGGSTLQSSRFSTGGSILGSTGAGQSLFDEQSFEAYRNQGRARKEEIIEIYAPAGKLGVVIDTPNTGAPILHRIKETCPIADKLRVGDRLIAVDDEDVRSMTAVKVSKLISQKSANPTRKFTIVRSL
eukprot:CAMPEP_0176495116 /NCGR_PEP_ID=MMETSP0200_2-20121128/10476_1 /TAXON_ID=947934 /ORGANISM="Chaetoceros sp., Strain GSL56" /LENGTH=498 /DNA_ID=CAMNT_0017892955 /DNA_START=192 /DNA_END=1688 /DNA_ORIENTATION=-